MLNLDSLNEAQRRAVMHGEGPLLVLAGPGSGKTFTITQRILYLIEVMKVLPEEILVITFTREAALSMQRRFMEQATRIYPVNFGTFHSIFFNILKSINPSRTREILRESQKKSLILPKIKGLCKVNPEDVNQCVQEFLAAISYLKNTGKREEAVLKISEEKREQFDAIFYAYEKARAERGAIDFDDMVYECAKNLRENKQARAYWQGRFSHILMDEFQDINPMQYEVIRLLTTQSFNLFAVGDDDQAIYGFRGSKPACMKQFVEEYGAKQILLNINYRSFPSIVKASLQVISENKQRFEKDLQPYKMEKLHAIGQVVLKQFVEREEEYTYLLEKLGEWENAEESETCAVLFRTNLQLQSFAASLKRRGISYEMKEKSISIYEHFIVKDIMAYLRIGAGEHSRDLFLQIMNKPVRMISREALGLGGEVSIDTIKAYYGRNDFREGNYSYAEKVGRAISLLEKQLDYLKKASPYLAVQYICKIMGYEKYLEEEGRRQKGGQERLEEWVQILEWLKEEAKHYDNLQQWLKAQKDYEKEIKEAGNGRKSEGEKKESPVQLMTVHASKGLEFDRVFIPDCNEKVFPHGSMPDKESCEEERRIFYVAMTRAKKSLELLYLTGTKERPRLPSRFLNPLLENYSSTISSNSQLSRYSSKASATFSYSSSSSMKLNSGSSLGSSGFSL